MHEIERVIIGSSICHRPVIATGGLGRLYNFVLYLCRLNFLPVKILSVF
jgi:hypothetical protein